jgi:hypothetical protein
MRPNKWGADPMKTIFLSIAFMGLLVLGSHEAKAQLYEPYPYAPYGYAVPYQPYPYPQLYDPYYDLHVMHYQLYLQPYAGYPYYQPCCFVGGVGPVWTPPVVVVPPLRIVGPRPRVLPFRRR